MSAERDYEIRFLKGDGTVSLLFVTSCISDTHALETARRMMRPQFTAYEVWRGHTRVAAGT